MEQEITLGIYKYYGRRVKVEGNGRRIEYREESKRSKSGWTNALYIAMSEEFAKEATKIEE